MQGDLNSARVVTFLLVNEHVFCRVIKQYSKTSHVVRLHLPKIWNFETRGAQGGLASEAGHFLLLLSLLSFSADNRLDVTQER